MNEHAQAASAASPRPQGTPPAPAAAVDFTLNPYQRKRLLHAEFELVELYVDARGGKPLPQEQLVKRLEEVCESMGPSTRVARGLQTGVRMPDPPAVDLRAAIQRAAQDYNNADSDKDAAHLLLTALAPLIERDDDADITLPAAALQRMLEGLVNTLYSQQVSMRSLRDAAARHHLEAEGAA